MNRSPIARTWFARQILRIAVWEEHCGVRVSFVTTNEATEAVARQKVSAALGVLRAHAPTQLARLGSVLNGIFVHTVGGGLGAYRRDLDVCVLDLRWVICETTSAEDCASTIVHELTHARLFRAGFGYNERVRARIERICCRAESNFAARLPDTPVRARLEERLARYRALPAEHWTDEALRAKAARRRARWPWWQRLAYVLVTSARRKGAT